MKNFKKNQVIIYVIALMLVVAGYLNFTATNDLSTAVQISSSEEELAKTGNIGDAQLVSSNIVDNNSINDVSANTNNEVNKNNVESSENTNENNSENKSDNKNELTNNTNTKNETITTSNTNKDRSDYFTTSKLERETMYSQMLASYENILNSNNSLETQRQSATEEITKINKVKNSIMICENLIKTKGFEEAIVFVNGNSVSVIVDDEQLSTEKVAQIQNIISRELNTKVEDIHISSK